MVEGHGEEVLAYLDLSAGEHLEPVLECVTLWSGHKVRILPLGPPPGGPLGGGPRAPGAPGGPPGGGPLARVGGGAPAGGGALGGPAGGPRGGAPGGATRW